MLNAAMIFGNGMVLQRRKKITVWGNADPGSSVSVQLGKALAVTKADGDGTWSVILPEREAERGLKLIIESEDNKLEFQEVSIGEVWLAGGQSNMEFPLGFDIQGEQIVETERNMDIHFFDYPEITYEEQLNDYDYSEFGIWRHCTREDLPYFSAVGYYFAGPLQDALDIPIGIVGCNFGGTTACAWMEPDYLRDNAGKVWLEEYEEAVEYLDVELYQKNYRSNEMNDRTQIFRHPMNIAIVKKGFSREQQLELLQQSGEGNENLLPVPGPYYQNRPGGLYETMLKKIVPLALRGVIWYQGESDVFHAEEYEIVFRKLIENWRQLWKEELPFLFVQLAPYEEWMLLSGEKFPVIRACQEQVSKTLPGTWMASIGDCGMQWDIHPKNKQPVGHRLALLALGHVYGRDILCDAPEFVRADLVDGEIILMLHNAKGLYLEGETLNGLEALDAQNQQIKDIQACIRGENLVIYNGRNIKTIRFVQTGYYEVNLFNEAGIPLKPFEIKL